MLASADADLRFQMEEAGISADVQKAIYAEGFTSVRGFAGLEESREGVRAALKSSFKLDSAESPAMRKEIALLLAVWEGARSQLTYQAKNKEEAKQGTQNPLVQVFRILCHARQGRAGLEPHSRPRAKHWLHPSSSNLKRVFRRPRISGMSRLTRTWRGRPTAPLSILPPPCCASNPAAHLLYHRDHQKSFDFVIVVSAWRGIS